MNTMLNVGRELFNENRLDNIVWQQIGSEDQILLQEVQVLLQFSSKMWFQYIRLPEAKPWRTPLEAKAAKQEYKKLLL